MHGKGDTPFGSSAPLMITTIHPAAHDVKVFASELGEIHPERAAIELNEIHVPSRSCRGKLIVVMEGVLAQKAVHLTR